jgi:hypothetical protein
VYGAIAVIYQIARKYEFTLTEGRENLSLLTKNFFPTLQGLLAQALPNDTDAARELEVAILRTFWSCVYIDFQADVAEPA